MDSVSSSVQQGGGSKDIWHRSRSRSLVHLAYATTLAMTLTLVLVPRTRAGDEVCPFGSGVPPQLDLVIDGEVDKMVLWEVCLTSTYAETTLQGFGLTLPATTMYVVDSTKQAQRRMPAPPGRQWGLDLRGAERDGRVVLLATRSAGTTPIHELIHVLQEPMSEAQWLSEGAATYLEKRYLTEEEGRYDFTSDLSRWDAVIGDVKLQDLATQRGLNSFRGSQSYTLAWVAFHLILSESEVGLDVYFNCFIPQKKIVNWKTAFSRCFGLKVSDVYVLMDEYRATGLTELPSQRRERELLEFRQRVEACLVKAEKAGVVVIRAMC
ncbi:MAG: hypothetical protein BMS9Abin12_0619 [Acidimicrobiia bacterium]|nr:MAG: hypothetical protein BMS9Abin12_0619 [Acidimicrobiia bacterium]